MRLDREQLETEDLRLDYPRPKKKHCCLKLFFSLLLILLLVVFCSYLTLKLMIGPVITQVNQLPGDFPKELAIYQLEQAKIQIQTDEGRKKILALVDALPDWLVKPLLNYLADNLKTRLNQTFEESQIPKDFTAEDLKKILAGLKPEQIKTVSLSWDAVNQTKEQLAAFYQKKLGEADFQLKANLTDYEINLGFAKPDIFGQIFFQDAEATSSQVRMIINYLVK